MIKMNFISIVVKVEALDRVYDGGFEQYKRDNKRSIELAIENERLDENLLCFSVMGPADISSIVSNFVNLGLDVFKVRNEKKFYKDLCIIEVPFGLDKPCDWIMYYGPIAAYINKEENRERVKQEVFEYYQYKVRQAELRRQHREIEEHKAKVGESAEIKGNFTLREVLLIWDDKSEVFPEKIYDTLFRTKGGNIEGLRKGYHNICKVKDNAEYYNLLGIIYANISRDDIEEITDADYYFKIAAEKGSINGAYNLAARSENLNDKFKWYLLGANNALKNSNDEVTYDIQRDVTNIIYTHLAIMYHKGIGVDINIVQAERWYKIAIKRGSYKAMLNLGVLYIGQNLVEKAVKVYSESLYLLRLNNIKGPEIDIMYNNLMLQLNMNDEQFALNQVASNFISFIKQKERLFDNSSCLNEMLTPLTHLKLDKGYLLDDFRPRDYTDSILDLYVRPFGTNRPNDKEFYKMMPKFRHIHDRKRSAKRTWFEKLQSVFTKKVKRVQQIHKLEPFDYITLPFEKVAIWEAYLLYQSRHLIGMRWHGCYDKRIFINSPKDIAKINEHKSELVKQKIYESWNSDLYPCITLEENKACIKHCWFDAWRGLVKITCNIQYDKQIKKITSFSFEQGKILIRYNCGLSY